MNRLTSGVSNEGFNETIAYDNMGNILSMNRNPMGTNTYSYSGNRLTAISGFVNGSYAYDGNGNQVSDSGKDITLNYNYLNLPQTISKASTSETMENTWLASGTKLRKVVGSLTRDYASGIEYNNGQIEFIQTEEGRAIPTGSNSYSYEYMLKDHLGNTRLLLKQDGSVLDSTDYYPFGLQIARSGQIVPSPENRYKYNGKELQTELGLGQYDYGARFYDPVIGRWNVIDPLADHPRQIGTSPYAAFNNNPIRYVDPTGMIWEDPKDAERLNKSVNDRLETIGKDNAKIQARIDKGGLSEKKLGRLQDRLADNNSQVGLLNQSLRDIKVIGEAKETYALASPSQSDGTHGVVKDSKGIIQIEGSNTGLHLHEIRHVGQGIEAGGVRFNSKGQLLNSAKTKAGGIINEVEAYQVGYSYDGQYPVGATSLKDINPTSLMKIKLLDGTIVYKALQD